MTHSHPETDEDERPSHRGLEAFLRGVGSVFCPWPQSERTSLREDVECALGRSLSSQQMSSGAARDRENMGHDLAMATARFVTENGWPETNSLQTLVLLDYLCRNMQSRRTVQQTTDRDMQRDTANVDEASAGERCDAMIAQAVRKLCERPSHERGPIVEALRNSSCRQHDVRLSRGASPHGTVRGAMRSPASSTGTASD